MQTSDWLSLFALLVSGASLAVSLRQHRQTDAHHREARTPRLSVFAKVEWDWEEDGDGNTYKHSPRLVAWINNDGPVPVSVMSLQITRVPAPPGLADHPAGNDTVAVTPGTWMLAGFLTETPRLIAAGEAIALKGQMFDAIRGSFAAADGTDLYVVVSAVDASHREFRSEVIRIGDPAARIA